WKSSKNAYLWPIYNSYQLLSIKDDGTDPIPLEPGAPSVYHSEVKTCKDGSILFASSRSQNINLYQGRLNGVGVLSEVHQITHTQGRDGGASFSPDCKKIVWHSAPIGEKEVPSFKKLLSQGLYNPT